MLLDLEKCGYLTKFRNVSSAAVEPEAFKHVLCLSLILSTRIYSCTQSVAGDTPSTPQVPIKTVLPTRLSDDTIQPLSKEEAGTTTKAPSAPSAEGCPACQQRSCNTPKEQNHHGHMVRILTLGPSHCQRLKAHHILWLGAREVLMATVRLVQRLQVAGVAGVGLRTNVVQSASE